MQYTIKKFILNGLPWYNLEDIPQGYMKIANIRSSSDRKAINKAKKVCIDPDISTKFSICSR